MCKPKSEGPRCAGHTRPIFDKAREKARETRLAYESDPHNEGKRQAFLAARQDLYNAWVDHSTTPKGMGELLQTINDRTEKGLDVTQHWAVVEVAERKRAIQMRVREALAVTPVVTESSHHMLRGRKIAFESHALSQARKKMFDMATINETFKHPEEVYKNGRYEGQWRITGNGICLVGEPSKDGKTFRVITMYLDKVVTPPRPDQLRTAEGRDFARRFATSGGRAR